MHTHAQVLPSAHATYGALHISFNGGSSFHLPPLLPPPTRWHILLLAQEGLRTDCRESFTLGLLPLVAIIGSDRLDRNTLMIAEYTTSLRKLESTIPPFEIEWLSVGAPHREKHVMVQCVMATTEHYLRVKVGHWR